MVVIEGLSWWLLGRLSRRLLLRLGLGRRMGLGLGLRRQPELRVALLWLWLSLLFVRAVLPISISVCVLPILRTFQLFLRAGELCTLQCATISVRAD